ncbi:hypothetical protein E5A73_20085 [Sphingomonas gei]|uniref:Uncharacterized protein n=2 Tax=Sphingomonas gei TaxID=1395960 RepID=A0A4S1WZW1_9SPHN|nr:hypothetical protein E5A73_20085 [Sphingomonas gei]
MNMTAETRNYVLDISTDLFQLSTESLRLHSNETLQYETLESLIERRAASDCFKNEHRTDTLRRHLGAIPTEGKVRIQFNILTTSAESLDEACEYLTLQLGSAVTVGDVLSVMLFDYVAEKKATQVLNQIGLGERTQSGGNFAPSETGSENVIPFR